MAEKLWYIYEEGLPAYVYQSRTDAERAMRELQSNSYNVGVDMQSVFMSDLEEFEEEYRQEWDLAQEEGLL